MGILKAGIIEGGEVGFELLQLVLFAPLLGYDGFELGYVGFEFGSAFLVLSDDTGYLLPPSTAKSPQN